MIMDHHTTIVLHMTVVVHHHLLQALVAGGIHLMIMMIGIQVLPGTLLAHGIQIGAVVGILIGKNN